MKSNRKETASSEQLSCKSQLVTTCHTRVHLRRRHVPVTLTAELTQISSQQTLDRTQSRQRWTTRPWVAQTKRDAQCSKKTIYLTMEYFNYKYRVRFEKLTVLQRVNKFPHFMRPKGTSPRSQHPATLHYHEPDQSRSRLANDFLKNNFNTILPHTSRSSRLSVSLKFPHQNHVRSSSAPHVLHTRHLVTVYLNTRIIFGEEYRS
jgi:hypothetical protein